MQIQERINVGMSLCVLTKIHLVKQKVHVLFEIELIREDTSAHYMQCVLPFLCSVYHQG